MKKKKSPRERQRAPDEAGGHGERERAGDSARSEAERTGISLPRGSLTCSERLSPLPPDSR